MQAKHILKEQYQDIRREVRELFLLFEISQALNLSKNIQDIVRPILEAMAEHMGMLRGTLTILNRETNEILIEEAYGLSDDELVRGRYKVGEGVTGKVVESGEPMVVPNVSTEPMFLDKTKARADLSRKDISFICVPVKLNKEVIGALSADRLFDESSKLEEDLRLLSIIGSMIAQSVQVHRTIQDERQLLQAENERLQNQLKDTFRPDNIIGNSNVMRKVYERVGLVSAVDTTVFIHGESGVGKELVAAAVHYNSSRADKPFIKINCSALSEHLIESEMFGHEKGAFTGATETRPGRFELADGGTLFLDEIGELSLHIQSKLLRVLQEREFERVGGRKTIKTDVRLITATNRDVEELVAEGTFRQDLLYRINVFPINIPPLRDRKTDIMLLADHFVEKYNKKLSRDVRRISTPAIDMLMSYHWPGNVRELENSIEHAVLLSTDRVIHSYHLPPSLQTAEATDTVNKGRLDVVLANVERDMIIDALKSNSGNMTKAAEQLGITERIMGLRVRKYGITPKKYRT